LTIKLTTLKIVQKKQKERESNLTLSLCDVPLLEKERDVLAKPKQGEAKDKTLRSRLP
jgi:hypothetical protein